MEPSIESFCVLPNMPAFIAHTSSCGLLREGSDAINLFSYNPPITSHNSCFTLKINFKQLNSEKFHLRYHRTDLKKNTGQPGHVTINKINLHYVNIDPPELEVRT